LSTRYCLSDLWITSAKKVSKLCGVYQITCLVDGRIYIGSASGAEGFSGRVRKHINALTRGAHHSPALQQAVNTYNAENFSFEILQITPRDQAVAAEQKFLDTLKPFGQKGFNTSTRADAIRGVLSDSGRQKIRESKLGTKLSEEAKRKIGIANKGRVKSEATRKKISEAGKGKPYPKNAYPALLAKIAKHYELEKDGTVYKGRNVKEFAKTHGVSEASLGNVLRGEQVSCGGFHLPGVKLPVAKVHYAKSPDGKIHEIANLNKFCKAHGLRQSALWNVLTKQRSSYKSSNGWTASTLEAYARQENVNSPFMFKTIAGDGGYAYNILQIL